MWTFALATIVAGCTSGAGGAEPLACADTDSHVLASSDWEIDDVVLLADERGWVVFWVSPACLCAPDRQGLFAARRGQQPVRVSDLAGMDVRGLAVDGGLLVCWSGHCGIVDADLRLAAGPFDEEALYARIGAQLYGLQFRSDAHWLATVGEDGRGWGPSVPLPCGPSGWNDQALACVSTRASGCGTQFEEPEADCALRFRAIDVEGRFVSDEVVVGQAPEWGEGGRVSVTGHPSGFLVTASDGGSVHARFVDAAGAVGGQVDLEEPVFVPRAFPIAAGFVVSWSAQPASGFPGSGVRLLVLDARGAIVSGPEWLRDPTPLAHEGSASVAAHRGGWAIAWTRSEGANEDQRTTVLLRSMGCE